MHSLPVPQAQTAQFPVPTKDHANTRRRWRLNANESEETAVRGNVVGCAERPSGSERERRHGAFGSDFEPVTRIAPRPHDELTAANEGQRLAVGQENRKLP